MVVARDANALRDGFERASIEAKEAFGDGTLFVERYVERARHVEVQVLGRWQRAACCTSASAIVRCSGAIRR